MQNRSNITHLLSRAGIAAAMAVGVASLATVPARASSPPTSITVNPGQSIQSAIDAVANGGVVLIEPGTYHENINFHGKAITVESLQGAKKTIIDGGNRGSVVTFNSGEGLQSQLLNLTLTHGQNADNGGGIDISSSSPNISGDIVTHNNAGNSGGGIGVSFGSPLLLNNVVSNNSQSSGSSGGVGGGGISVTGAASAQLIGNTVTSNSWASASGGGIELFAAGTPTLIDNVVQNNSAYYSGGGIDMVNQSDAIVVQNLITGNHSELGGGVSFDTPYGTHGPVFTNNTVAGNTANYGTALAAGGFDTSVGLYNNILTGPSTQPAVDCSPGYTPVISHNDAFNGTATAWASDCGPATSSNGNFSLDPMFVSPTTSDFHVSQGSPAIRAGTTSAPNLPSVDLSGHKRVTHSSVDLGVYQIANPLTFFTYTSTGPTNGGAPSGSYTSANANFSMTGMWGHPLTPSYGFELFGITPGNAHFWDADIVPAHAATLQTITYTTLKQIGLPTNSGIEVDLSADGLTRTSCSHIVGAVTLTTLVQNSSGVLTDVAGNFNVSCNEGGIVVGMSGAFSWSG